MQKRVLFLTGHDIWGSVESFSPMYKILLFLAEKDYLVDFITIDKHSSFDKTSKKYGDPIDFIHENVKITRLKIFSRKFLKSVEQFPAIGRFVEKIRYEWLLGKRVIEFVSKNKVKYDLVYAYEIYLVSVASKLSKDKGVPLITRFQGTFYLDWYNSYLEKGKMREFKFKYHLHTKALSTAADLVIMTDDGTMGDKVLELLNNKSDRLFLKNGFDFKRSLKDKYQLRRELNLPIDKVLTVSVSRLSKWKRLERIVFAYSELIKENDNLVHVFVGDGEEYNNLVNLCSREGLGANMLFIGQVNHEKVVDYLSSCDIFLSFFDSTNAGNPLQEAIKIGMPIITYDVGDTNKIIKDGYNGVLLQSVEPSKIAKEILNLAKNSSFREQLIMGARNTSDQMWSWEDRLWFETDSIEKIMARYEKPNGK